MRRLRMLVVSCVAALAACSGGAGPASRDGPPVEQALSLVPPGTTEVYFTHWAELAEDPKDFLYASAGARDLYEDLQPRGLVPLASFDSYMYDEFEELWGWNTDDLEWEAVFAQPSLHLLRFREPIDRDDLVGRLEEREYSRSEQGGIEVYHHEEDLDAPWFSSNFGPRAPIAVLNMAILDDHTLMLAHEQDRLEDAVAAIAEGEAGHEALAEAVERVGEAAVVMAFTGGDLCDLHDTSSMVVDDEAFDNADALSGHEYEALAIGVAGPDDEPGATAVFRYEDPADAAGDLDLREEAANGPSLATGEPYSDSVFTLEDASVDGEDLVMELAPSEQGSLALAEAVRAGDLTFAAC